MAHSRQFLEVAHLHVHLDDLVEICKDYHSRVFKLEGDKWDLERGVKIRILEVWRLRDSVRSPADLFRHRIPIDEPNRGLSQ